MISSKWYAEVKNGIIITSKVNLTFLLIEGPLNQIKKFFSFIGLSLNHQKCLRSINVCGSSLDLSALILLTFSLYSHMYDSLKVITIATKSHGNRQNIFLQNVCKDDMLLLNTKTIFSLK